MSERGARLFIGALAGIAGTVAMTAAMRAAHRALPPAERYPLPPREIIERATPGPVVRAADERRRRELTLAGHFGYGAASGALWALAFPRGGPAAGAAYGVGVWTASYLGWIPAARILRPAVSHPWRRNLLMVGVHLIWGGTMALTVREVELAQAQVFAGAAAPDRPPRP